MATVATSAQKCPLNAAVLIHDDSCRQAGMTNLPWSAISESQHDSQLAGAGCLAFTLLLAPLAARRARHSRWAATRRGHRAARGPFRGYCGEGMAHRSRGGFVWDIKPKAPGRLPPWLEPLPAGRSLQLPGLNYAVTKSRPNRFENFRLSTQAHERFDYTVPTHLAHRHPTYAADGREGLSSVAQYDPAVHGEVYGDFADIRKTFDYSWHVNYSRDRQLWQDTLVRQAVGVAVPQEQPWAVFTCGAMGAGKGHVMGWLARHRSFPLKNMARIDPDLFKSAMPEWDGYKRKDKMQAGSMCHKESAFLQQLAQEVAMRARRDVWIDGTLADFGWYSHIFQDMRKRFPEYRIAIVYVYCSPDEVIARASRRGLQTGRFVPEETLWKSVEATKRSVDALGPLADVVAKVDNQAGTPWLQLCSEHSLAGGASSQKSQRSLAAFLAKVSLQAGAPRIEVRKSVKVLRHRVNEAMMA